MKEFLLWCLALVVALGLGYVLILIVHNAFEWAMVKIGAERGGDEEE